MNEAANDPSVKVAVLTGTGEYYSSGNDLNNFAKMMSMVGDAADPLAASAKVGGEVMVKFEEAFINFPKPLIAMVNGPAVGIMVTTLSLCDAVLASDTATFSTPFTSLAQSPEGCSSLTFPLIMGTLVASDVLLFGRVLNAQEAANFGLVSRVVPKDKFDQVCGSFIQNVAALPTGSMQASKRLIRGASGQAMSRDTLLKVCHEEAETLMKCWQSEECAAAIANFLSKSKKKSSL